MHFSKYPPDVAFIGALVNCIDFLSIDDCKENRNTRTGEKKRDRDTHPNCKRDRDTRPNCKRDRDTGPSGERTQSQMFKRRGHGAKCLGDT